MDGKVLHVMNGDAAAGILKRSAVAGTATVWADVLHDGSDWIELNGMDRWLGGVHLEGDDAVWR